MSTAVLEPLQARLRATLPDANLHVRQFPRCPGVQLALINTDFQTGPLPSETMHAVIAKPAYWAFCWGSGLALARYLLSKPEAVAGLSVLDVGSGSGIAGIAAALAGAERVIACDIDADARLASQTNAALSGVTIEICDDLANAPICDVALLADVLYDRSNLPLLALTRQHARCVLVADSRVRELDDSAYELVAEDRALTEPNLGEFDEFANVRIWQAHTA